MAQHKRMTNREKAENARIKRKLQEKGIIPPDKPRLNRRKFVETAIQEWTSKDTEIFGRDFFLHKAISIMLGKVDRNLRVTQEAVGVAKCLKLAIRLSEFHERIKAEGRESYTIKEQLDYIKDILDA